MVSIVTKALSHSYFEKEYDHLVLDQLELAIDEGESICIMGASGSGKSTLLHILSGLLKPKSGEVFYNEISLWGISNAKRTQYRSEHMGFMFQKQHFFPELSVVENVALPLRILAKANACEQAESLLDKMQMDRRYYYRYPNELSGGEQARVGLARALAHAPKVLFADEPTAALDNALAQSVFKDIKKLQEKLGFLMVVATHDESLRPYFDKVYHLHNGKLELSID